MAEIRTFHNLTQKHLVSQTERSDFGHSLYVLISELQVQEAAVTNDIRCRWPQNRQLWMTIW